MSSSHLLVTAFNTVSQGYSIDRVVADPELNSEFLVVCQELGLKQPPGELNRRLMNLRKAGEFSGRPRAIRTHFPDEDEYRFTAEMAIRFMERKHAVSLDSVICDPALAAEFDLLAGSICPGFTVLQYRWAALGLRKARSLQPEIAARILPPETLLHLKVADLRITTVPQRQGLYLFFDTDTCLYVGETENLFRRLKKHLDHADNKGLARWMWEQGMDNLNLEIQVLPDVSTQIRKALELELIRSRKPVFNVQR
ncbi:MAG: GIY-YIG nuclease family protein [Planctomycetaceae bacterium]